MTLTFEEQLKMEEKERSRTMSNLDPYGFRTAFDIWEERERRNGDHG